MGLKPFTFIAQGKPKAKGRPKFARGRAYTPKSTLDAEAALAAQYTGPLFDGPLGVHIEFGKDYQLVTITPLGSEHASAATADVDNLVKTTLDALNGVAWGDDRQVVRLEAVKCH